MKLFLITLLYIASAIVLYFLLNTALAAKTITLDFFYLASIACSFCLIAQWLKFYNYINSKN